MSRLRRWLARIVRFLAEGGESYYYTGYPADPRWEDRDQ